MLNELLAYGDSGDPDFGKELTEREVKFIEKLDAQGRRWDLTSYQLDKLQEIWEKIFNA